MSVDTIKDVITLVKDIVTGIAAVIAVVIAWRGLSTWNRQLKGTRDSELSRRILVALYKAEMMIREIRSPFVTYLLPPDASPYDKEASNKAWAKHLEDKWRELSETLAELQAAGIEAKAVWDKNFMDNMDAFFVSVHELYDHLNDNIQQKLNPDYDALYENRENRKIIFGTFSETDEFGKRVLEHISKTDNKVREYLTLK